MTQNKRQTYLVVNADDLGISENIDTGIIDAHKNGIVTSASIFLNYDYLPQTLEALSEVKHLDVGPHINLTWGKSLTESSSLTRNGEFLGGIKQLFLSSWTGKLNYSEVLKEIEAQLARFSDSGLTSTQLNTHQHIILVPQVAAAIAELAPRFGYHWIRSPFEVLGFKKISGLVLNSYAAGLYFWKKLVRTHNIAGVLYAGHIDEDFLEKMIISLKPGICELVCHPAKPDTGKNDNLRKNRLGETRVIEHRALTSDQIRNRWNNMVFS